jgi:multisubunit Na+/H+ antiporter MnhG subunit
MRDAIVAVLLAAGVGIAALATLGVVLMRTAIDRVHYAGAAGAAAVCVTAAVLVRDSFSLAGDKALLLAVFLLLTSPLVTHVTARAIAEGRAR